MGAGAVFLNTSHPNAVLNDINQDLIGLYQALQTTPAAFIRKAHSLFVTKNNEAKAYYRLRNQFNQSNNTTERALLFLYLNRHGYNGLCRYNLSGGYNVPFGAYKRPYFPQKELQQFADHLQRATLRCANYESLLLEYLQATTLKDHVFYCDPPYAPLGGSVTNFTGYAANRFTLEDQTKLAELARALAAKGATVLMSNHDTPFTRKIYRGAKITKLTVQRNISCIPGKRAKVAEIMAYFRAEA